MKNIKKCFISLNSSIEEAIQGINSTPYQIALVIDGEILKGVVTDGDIRRALLQKKSLDSPVEKIMQKHFQFLSDA